jgi:hypothetical protein
VKLFWEFSFDDWERGRIQDLANQIKGEDETYLLKVNADQYFDHLLSEFALDHLNLHFESVEATDEERMIPAERFPPMSFVSRGRSYPKQVFTFHVPVSGPLGLLRIAPSPRLQWTIEVELNHDQKTVSFDVVRFGEDMNGVNAAYDGIVNKITEQLRNLAVNIDQYDVAVKIRAKELFERRKSELTKKTEFRSALKVPIRKSTAPATFAVPVASPKRIVPRPAISAGSYTIDPTLDSSLYQEILQLMHDFGKQLERLPETYKHKNEETLRDHFLLMLQPHFGLEGSATGETFNASGKTDILVRYQNQNVFVAEFKFWRGPKQHLGTIDQLLSYLTWRESKAALVYFMEGKEIAGPLKAIEDSTPQHQSFVAFNGKSEESWFRFEFRLGDKDKNVQVAVLCFHLPK